MKINYLSKPIFLVLLFSISLFSAEIKGKITDAESGMPVSDAKIFAVGLNYTDCDSIWFDTLSADDGSFILPGLPAGIYGVHCDHPDYYPQYQTVNLHKQDSSAAIYFELLPKYCPGYDNFFGGIVFNAVTKGIVAGAEIFLAPVVNGVVSPADSDRPEFVYSVRSDSNGSYAFKDIIPGSYQLSAHADGFHHFIPEMIIKIDEDTKIDDFHIYLTPIDDPAVFAELKGYVWEDSGPLTGIPVYVKPVYPAVIEVFGTDASGQTFYYRTTNNPDGSYKLKGIYPGTYSIYCSARKYYNKFIREHRLPAGENYLNFWLKPKDGHPIGAITGHVIFDDVDCICPVIGAVIEFIPAYNTLTAVNQRYKTKTNEQGYYGARLPAGKYFVSCTYYYCRHDGQDSTAFDSLSHDRCWSVYYREYYDDVLTIKKAKVVEVRKNHVTRDINFGIPYSYPYGEVTVSGRVTDEDSNPLQNALVRLWPQQSWFRPDWPIRSDIPDLSARTGDDGYYSITFDNTWLKAWSVIAAADKDGFAAEFYKEKPEFYLADKIRVYGHGRVNNINFTLAKDPPVEHSLSGTVSSADGMRLANAFVVTANVTTGEVFTAFTGNDGSYAFNQTSAGIYYVLFAYPGYVPEFYDDKLLWENADPVKVYGEVSGIDAVLAPVIIDSSLGRITGTVTNQQNAPLSGVMLTAVNEDGNVAGACFSGEDGSYDLAGIGNGVYTVQASKINYNSASHTYESNLELQATLLLDFTLSQSAVSVEENKDEFFLPKKSLLGANYPNPFNPSTSFSFALPQTMNVKIAVYNILGQKVRELYNAPASAGVHTLSWDGLDEGGAMSASGIYLLMMETADSRLVHKMVLSK